jgi:uncharacterized membrane protein
MLLLHPVIILAHVSLGTLAVIAGAGALLARKGGSIHRRVGQLFAITMGIASLLGAILGVLHPAEFYITFHAGILGLTLIAGSWLTIQQAGQHRSPLMTGISVLNLLNLSGLVAFGLQALSSPDGRVFGFAAEDYFFLGGMTAMVAIGDISLLFRPRLSEKHRVARHLWRMCLGFFIAAGSAFTGPGAAIFPDAIQQSGVLSLPEILIALAMISWLARTWWRGPAFANAGKAD